ncbi:Transposase ISRhOegibbosus7 [Candidatus Rhabdochlamydia oedothoracis]|uniref:Transposase ISRhOegibbosus7 n=1 Tax=Candidatus Rhabdochlamydia oedothoracis TaxID=2720720 RepID=A0ABX8V240_9BACT|nr:IS110 family transposase [Candidatus Rhabdochlamydia oedothoracis]QYF49211.1 Transposase ISRhOegibbosus7 [Candidatus Rhabdochlamydia oedothoracis]
MKHYIGLDVSMKRTFICVLNEQGKIVHEGSEKTDPDLLADYFSKRDFQEIVVGFESGCLSHYLVTGFRKRAIDPLCMDARKLSTILALKINKTDKNDARGIAEALRSGMYTRVHCKPQDSVEKSILLVSRRALIKQQTQLKNTVRGLLKSYGIRLGSVGSKRFSSVVIKQIEKQEKSIVLSITSLLNTFDKVVEEVEKLDKEMLKLVSQDKEVQRLMTIPGVGPVTALTYKTEIFDPTRFNDSKSVGAYLGMTPKQYASGEVQRQGRISKCGSSELRSLLVEAGIVMLTRSKKWSKLKAWGLKIMRKKGMKKAALAVGRKLSVIMHKMLIEQKEFIYGEPKAA